MLRARCRASRRARTRLDLVDRQLEEARAGDAEDLGVAGGQEPVGALAARVVLDPLAGERLGDLACGLLGREDERDAAAEDTLEDRPDQRVVRAAEDHRVDVGRPSAARRTRAPRPPSRARTGRRSRSAVRAAGRRTDVTPHAGVERPHELLVAAATRPSPCVASSPIRRLRVAWTAACASGVITPTTGTDSDSWSSGSAAEVARVARDEDQLHALPLEVARRSRARSAPPPAAVAGPYGSRAPSPR